MRCQRQRDQGDLLARLPEHVGHGVPGESGPLEKVGRRRSGADRQHPDPGSPEFLAKGEAPVEHERLRGPVGREVRRRLERRGRGYRDDRAAARPNDRQKLARQLDHRANVDVHHFKLLIGAGFRKVAVEAEPAVVDE